MEASALQAPATLPDTRVALGTPLLRFRSDEQLVALFRAGHEEAFRAIHDRYHKRLFAYARQMLPGRQDAEDALQDVFVRAYAGLRASNQDLALRAWLFRVAHNRCIDELRRPAPPAPEVLQLVRAASHDPLVELDLRESLRRLIEDIRRLPEQQRSALLMRELAGMPYSDLSASLGISVGAVKSLLVRARVALAQAAEARDTSCLLIREQLVEAHDRGLRPNAMARKHMRDCVGCKSFRRELRGMSRQLAAVAPAIGPLGVLAKTLGISGGAGGGGGLALLGGGGASASAGGLAVGVNHVATLLVAAVATAGGAVELQHAISPTPHHAAAKAALTAHQHAATATSSSAATPSAIQTIARDVEATVSTAPKLAASAAPTAASQIQATVPRKMTADAAFGGPVSGASTLHESSKTTGSSSTTSGTDSKTGSDPKTSSNCSSLVPSGSSSGSTATTSSAESDSTEAPTGANSGTAVATVPVNAVAKTPCVMTSSSSPQTSASTPSSTTSSNGPTSSPSTTGGGTGTGTDSSTTTSSSGSSSSPGTTTTDGSDSAGK